MNAHKGASALAFHPALRAGIGFSRAGQKTARCQQASPPLAELDPSNAAKAGCRREHSHFDAHLQQCFTNR
ncbi:hypothetical protein [Rhizobium rhizosphaerae]|uniref:hypothetical protein n=1 Tax=Xaviernesmea rhizosphaerae TaxID=1672749 RepID=UPI00117A496D|nr:hypothetical protein [Xaviernesmea rhizosphaerae]